MKEIEEQKVKLDRVAKQTSKLIKEIKAKKGSGAEEVCPSCNSHKFL